MADTESIKELFLRRLQKVLSIVSLATVVLLLLQVTTGIAGPEWFRLYLFPGSYGLLHPFHHVFVRGAH